MLTRAEEIEARLIALEMLFRGMLAGMVSGCSNPIAEVDRMAEEFRSSTGLLRVDVEGGAPDHDDHAEKMRAVILAKVDENFEAIRGRAMRALEIEAASAGRKN
jgi:hypothetical protein